MIEVDLLKKSLKVTELDLKREIVLVIGEKGLRDLYHLTDFYLVDIYCLKGFLEGAHQLDGRVRLKNALLDVVKHLSDNG